MSLENHQCQEEIHLHSSFSSQLFLLECNLHTYYGVLHSDGFPFPNVFFSKGPMIKQHGPPKTVDGEIRRIRQQLSHYHIARGFSSIVGTGRGRVYQIYWTGTPCWYCSQQNCFTQQLILVNYFP